MLKVRGRKMMEKKTFNERKILAELQRKKMKAPTMGETETVNSINIIFGLILFFHKLISF